MTDWVSAPLSDRRPSGWLHAQTNASSGQTVTTRLAEKKCPQTFSGYTNFALLNESPLPEDWSKNDIPR